MPTLHSSSKFDREWLDGAIEIPDSESFSFIKFRVSKEKFSHFKSRDILWITDDGNLITYICDPKDILQKAKIVRSVMVQLDLKTISFMETSYQEQKNVKVVTIECDKEIVSKSRHKLGKSLYFYFKDSTEAESMMNAIYMHREELKSPGGSDDSAFYVQDSAPQREPQGILKKCGSNGHSSEYHNGISKTVTISRETPEFIVPESPDGSGCLELPFGTQIPLHSFAPPCGQIQKGKKLKKEETCHLPQNDYEDLKKKLDESEEACEMFRILEALDHEFVESWYVDQEKMWQVEKRLHKIFWQGVSLEEKEKWQEDQIFIAQLQDKQSFMKKEIEFHVAYFEQRLKCSSTAAELLNLQIATERRRENFIADLKGSF